MENKFEIGRNPEEQKKESEVLLHFFRHGETERDPGKTNQEFKLSEEGRKQAIKKSSAISDARERNLEQSVAFGSPRWRAQQTAAFAMTGESPGVTNNTESLEECKEKIDQDIKVGTKIGVDPRLDFHLDKNTPFGREAYKAVFEDKDYMKFLVNRSDELAIETGDQEASTYSSQAKQVAEIIKKYVSVGKQWGKLIQSKTYEDPKLERFLGTHGGVAESFLLKVVEMTKGVEERDRLLDRMPHQFDYTEGFDITLTNQEQEQVLYIAFKKEDKESPEKSFVFDENVPLEVIDEIIEDTGVIREKFKEWTEGKELLESRTEIFNCLREIPYTVVEGRDPKKAPDELLLEDKGSCSAKHVVLKKMFDKLGIQTRYASQRFKWSGLPVEYPEDIKQLSEQMPTCDHLFCQALIDGKWVDVDATWDSRLQKAGFPVNDWDGYSDTTTAVGLKERNVYNNIKERSQSKKELAGGYTKEEEAIQPEFYKKLNEWLEQIRSASR